MRRDDVVHIIDAPINSQVSFGGKTAKVVGKFGEAYYFKSGRSYAHILSLEGQQEIGAECRDGEWFIFNSRYVKTVQDTNLPRLRQVLDGIEEGEIEKDYSDGDTGWDYMRYMFGTTRNGRGVFLGIRGYAVDVWVNDRPEKVEVAMV